MIRIILCEGETDATLLGLYLEKTTSWRYNTERKPKLKMNIPQTVPLSNKKSFNYIKDNEDLLICAVGGKDNFNNVYTNYIHRFIISGNNNDFLNLVIVIDADEDKYSNINSLKLNGLNLIENERVKNGLMNLYGDEEILINCFLKIIPEKESGALEDLIIKSLVDSHPYITEESCQFVDALDKNKVEHLKFARTIAKVKVGTIFNIIDPQRTFSSLSEKFEMIDLTSPNILNTFKFLHSIFVN